MLIREPTCNIAIILSQALTYGGILLFFFLVNSAEDNFQK